jgi:cytochrome c biogenesis protein CcdA
VRVARVLAALAAVTFVAGLATTFGITYRDQSRRLDRVERERNALRVENRRLGTSLGAAQVALTSLNAGLAASRANIAAARETADARYREGYAAGFMWAIGATPGGAADIPDVRLASGHYGR